MIISIDNIPAIILEQLMNENSVFHAHYRIFYKGETRYVYFNQEKQKWILISKEQTRKNMFDQQKGIL